MRCYGAEVLCVALQTVVDAFGFWRYVEGGLTRSLVFGFLGDEDRVWNEVSGESEPWEERAIFRESEDLRAMVEELEGEPRELARRFYREREFVIGGELPRVSGASGLVEAVHEH